MTSVLGSLRRAREWAYPQLTESAFLEKGVLTPEEFLRAGDELVFRCPTWEWSSSPKASKEKSYLPPNKQYLITRNVPCRNRVSSLETNLKMEREGFESGENGDEGDDWMVSTLLAEGEDDQGIGDGFDILDEDGEVVVAPGPDGGGGAETNSGGGGGTGAGAPFPPEDSGGGGDDDENAPSCFDVTQEIPAGANAKIRGSDNSGSGGGTEGRIWEFQCCKDLIVRAGYSTNSMFLPRPFSYEWHEEHCRERFPGIAVEPYRMNDQWGFADLTKTSRIVFANGMNDGWSVASITNATEVSDALGFRELVVLDFPNGAHHSELKAGPYPNPSDTPDILEGYQKATEILSGWLDDIAANQEVL
mmetsp:Transcript_658/g.1409  ORF Transcript_658/g.1409 Transcript_658/m.1409 type:complete len:361 (+) Transcript_658:157-1239(+)